ncbi:unnamed protein product [Callosobruchus maculatus]|uniref:EB domain-containing protein n=1 Tax=Callosobruchus maculatus TaxID=64391 RepID=A0A653DHB9_CALMS|nr:unnamed protein product [Callosobruchus maculatus]
MSRASWPTAEGITATTMANGASFGLRLCLTVSVPLLLLIFAVGLNHAHGLTTFGKTQNQDQNLPRHQASLDLMDIKVCLALALPLLLTFACFNDAFGLTTFGISPNQNSKNAKHLPGNTKPCTDQSNCTYIKDTTCLKGFCYCGDNTHPVNGRCKVAEKGHSHICQKEEECVEGATCIVRPKEFQTSSTSYLNNYTVCWCEDGVAFPNGRCAGDRFFSSSIFVASMLLISTFVKTIYS